MGFILNAELLFVLLLFANELFRLSLGQRAFLQRLQVLAVVVDMVHYVVLELGVMLHHTAYVLVVQPLRGIQTSQAAQYTSLQVAYTRAVMGSGVEDLTAIGRQTDPVVTFVLSVRSKDCDLTVAVEDNLLIIHTYGCRSAYGHRNDQRKEKDTFSHNIVFIPLTM